MLTDIIVSRATANAMERKLPSMMPDDCLLLRQNSELSENMF